MFNLTIDEIESAFQAIQHHGYSALLPPPPEWEVVKDNWEKIKDEISKLDLDTYHPTEPLRVYAPKSRATVRVVHLLHPIDLIIYTALTLIVRDDLERARVAPNKKMVYSYRAEIGVPNRLYGRSPTFTDFTARIKDRSARKSVKYIAIADIADFYPRIYQHRLENIIESSSVDQRGRDVARVLVKKLIGHLSGKNSYGIPVGPLASRTLAEAVLIDVDSYLISEGYDFTRWVDDYYFYCKDEGGAQQILIGLAERLYGKHGLTLSALKTKIVTKEVFVKRFENDPDKVVDDRFAHFKELSDLVDPYDDEPLALTDNQQAEIAGVDFAAFIAELIEDRDLADYSTISSLLRRPEVFSALPVAARKRVAQVLLKNIDQLYPVSADAAHFFSLFSDYTWKDLKKIRTSLLNSVKQKNGRWPPEYYIMWILSVFSSSKKWRESPDYVRLFRDHRSDMIRRMAALAIARNGTRSDAVDIKDGFAAASPIERLGILLASRKLGTDERKHWRTSLQLTGILEKLI